MRLLERQQAAMRTLAPRTTIRPAKTSIVSQAFVEAGTRWTFPQVLAAVDAHEAGDFSQSGLLIAAMGRDDRISACMRTRVNAIVGANGLDFAILPPEGDDNALAERVETWWFDALPDAALRAIVWDMVLAGFFLGRKHWTRTAREWLPYRIERWHPANVRYDRQLGRYVARFDGGEAVVEPGDPEWLLITPGGDESWMSGAVRALGAAYVMRQFNWRDWSRFNEKHGMPLLTIKEPANADPTQKRNFFAGVQRMGSTGIVRLPVNTAGEGFGLEYVEAKDGAHVTFQNFRTDLDAAIAITLLGQNLSTEIKGGSYAAAGAHDRIRMDYLAADVEVLSTGLRDQLIKPWGRFNLPGWKDEDAPWPTWDTTPAIDRQAEATTIKTVADAVTVFQTTGMPVDYAELFERLGLPVVEGQDPNEAQALPAPVPTPPADDAEGDDVPPDPPDNKPKTTAPVAPRTTMPRRTKPTSKSGRLLEPGRGLLSAANPGMVAGQAYVDDLVESGQEQAAKGDSRSAGAGAAFLDEVLAIIDRGGDYEELRRTVLAAYEGHDPVHARGVLEKVMTLAELAGRRAVLDDAPEVDDVPSEDEDA